MMRKESEHPYRAERSLVMSSVAYLSEQLSRVLEERANEIARETGCLQRQRKFSGASLLQTLVFGWQQHPDASLEQLASTAATADVLVTDTAVDKRFTPQAARFLHAMLEEACSQVVQAAHDVPLALLRRGSRGDVGREREHQLAQRIGPGLAGLWRLARGQRPRSHT